MAEALDLAEIRADALITLGRARVFLADAEGLEDIEQGLALAVATNSLIVAERGYEALWLAIAIEATASFGVYPRSTRSRSASRSVSETFTCSALPKAP